MSNIIRKQRYSSYYSGNNFHHIFHFQEGGNPVVLTVACISDQVLNDGFCYIYLQKTADICFTNGQAI